MDADSFETFAKHDNLWYPMETGVGFSEVTGGRN